MSRFFIGIDLGTTYSAAAYVDSSGKPETIRSEEGELTTPSVVFFDDATPIIGKEAVKAAEFETDQVARYAKRCIGQSHFPKTLKGERVPPELIEALILQQLRNDAVRTLDEVAGAVITVPAYFNESRRKATQDAGAISGLNVIDIINEPTAAAIAYGVQAGFLNQQGRAEEKECVLVYDLGGGTFDATLMEIEGQQFNALATAGDVYLGGIDWDQRLVEHFADYFQSTCEVDLRDDPTAMERLLQQAESVKKTLSVRPNATVRIQHEGNTARLDVSREEFQEMTADLLERTRMTCEKLLNDAGKKWSDLTRLILVGGSTRMPMVQQMLEQESGLQVDRSLAPDEAVAHGAAIYASLIGGEGKALSGISIANINSHDLGVMGVDPNTKQARRQIMIPRNSRIPATNVRQFQTSKVGQKDVLINVVEGGDDHGEHAIPIGKCIVSNLPEDLPKGSVVKVTFRYEKDGRLHVTAELPDVDCTARTLIRRASGMSSDEVKFWRSVFESGFDIHAKPAPKKKKKKKSKAQSKPSKTKATEPNPESPLAEEPTELDALLDQIGEQFPDELQPTNESESERILPKVEVDSQPIDSQPIVSQPDGSRQVGSKPVESKEADPAPDEQPPVPPAIPSIEPTREAVASQPAQVATDSDLPDEPALDISPSTSRKQEQVSETPTENSDSAKIDLSKLEEKPKETVGADDPELQAFFKGLK